MTDPKLIERAETCSKSLRNLSTGIGAPTKRLLNHSNTVSDLLTEIRRLNEIVERQNSELAEVHEDAFCEIGFKINDDSDLNGWWDSMARSDACEHGDWLVEHDLWESTPWVMDADGSIDLSKQPSVPQGRESRWA